MTATPDRRAYQQELLQTYQQAFQDLRDTLAKVVPNAAERLDLDVMIGICAELSGNIGAERARDQAFDRLCQSKAQEYLPEEPPKKRPTFRH